MTLEDIQKEWSNFALEWGWVLDFDSGVSSRTIFVDPFKRKITTTSTNLAERLLGVILGVECGPANSSEETTYTGRNLSGPKYWSNSCNTDSILSFIAFSEPSAYRKLILDSVDLLDTRPKTLSLLSEIFNPVGECSLLRRKLFGGETDMVSAGHSYDLLTDLFPMLKIPVVSRNHTIFYSSIPLEDYLSGDIDISKINHPVLVLENHLGYRYPQSRKPEKDRPSKKFKLVSHTKKWKLIGVTYLAGAEPSQEIFQTRKLGAHYYSVVETRDGPVKFDDLEPEGKPTDLGKKFSRRGRDIGVLYFFVNRGALTPQPLVVVNDTLIWISKRLEKLIEEMDYKKPGTHIYVSKDKIVAIFDLVSQRIKFEKTLRKELGE